MMNYINELLFGYYPYLAGTVFLVGSLVRYDRDQYTWKASSSQMLSNRRFRLANVLFHVGILGLFFGHLIGLLTPHWVYSVFISAPLKQFMAVLVGGVLGTLCLVGLTILLHRRLTDPRVRATSSKMDILVLVLIYEQLLLGLLTLPISLNHLDGHNMIVLGEWAQHIVTFRGDAAALVANVDVIFKVHLFLGMTLFLLFPFTRLVHIWSVPLGYLSRPYQVVRTR